MSELQYIPYIEMCAFAFLLMVTVYFFAKEGLFTIQRTLYGALLVSVLLSLIFDISTAYTISYSRVVSLWTNIILNTLLYSINLISSILMLLFSAVFTDNMFSPRKWLKTLGPFLLPSVAAFVMIAVNVETGILFSFKEGLFYTHGPFYATFCLICVFNIGSGMFLSFKNRNLITLSQLLTLNFYALLSLVSVILRIFFPKYLFTGAFSALGLMSMYFTFQNPDTYIDDMTKLFGRSGFLVAAGHALKWQKAPHSTIVLDINGFRTINNHFGLLVGDEIINSIVQFLQTIAPNKRNLFRIGGDQFALILPEDETARALEQIRRRFKYSWTILDNRLQLSVSVVKIPLSKYVLNKEFLMQLIEYSLDMAKEDSSSCLIADSGVISVIKRRMMIESTLNKFDSNNCLQLYFQPIYNVSKGCITSAEVLLRMKCGDLSSVPPDEFIRAAERTGMINRIGRYVLQEACRFISEYRVMNYGIEMLHLNLSPAECMQDNYAAYIKEVISSYPFKKEILNFEITETVAATSKNHVSEIMDVLREMGVKFSLDDYSQGYSNINTIISLPFDSIKLDKELLWNAFKSEKASIIFRHTVKMFKEMGLDIIAEGAETKEQVDYLCELGVDFIQGFYYGKPLSKEEFLKSITDLN